MLYLNTSRLYQAAEEYDADVRDAQSSDGAMIDVVSPCRIPPKK